MPIYTVRQGDCISSIARAYGFTDWRTIYNHAQNGSLRRLRPDPNVIHPGDQIFIPDREEGIEERATDQLHSFRRRFQPVSLRVVLVDEEHRPLANAAYTLTVGELPVEGQTGPDGLLEQTIPASLPSARLSVRFTRDGEEIGYTWDLRLGELDPETTMTGVQARLNNLGYNTGPVDGVQGPRTTDAVKQFQEKYSLTVDGVVGPITRSKLLEVYGC